MTHREFRRAHIQAAVSASPARPPERSARDCRGRSVPTMASGRISVVHSTAERSAPLSSESPVPLPVMPGRAQSLWPIVLQTSDRNGELTSIDEIFLHSRSGVREQTNTFHHLSFMGGDGRRYSTASKRGRCPKKHREVRLRSTRPNSVAEHSVIGTGGIGFHRNVSEGERFPRCKRIRIPKRRHCGET